MPRILLLRFFQFLSVLLTLRAERAWAINFDEDFICRTSTRVDCCDQLSTLSLIYLSWTWGTPGFWVTVAFFVLALLILGISIWDWNIRVFIAAIVMFGATYWTYLVPREGCEYVRPTEDVAG
jgi:hypothetical protein